MLQVKSMTQMFLPQLSKEAHEGSKLSMSRIADLLNVSIDEDETKVKYFC